MSCVNREQLRKDLLLYAVTDRSWLGNETLYEQVEKALKGGATFIQLREKELDEEHFMEEAVALKELCHKYHVPFVINDNVRIAKDMDADGVHVGQSDMEADDVRKILGEDKILGVSAQTVEQAVLAEKMGADYLGVGAVAIPTGIISAGFVEQYQRKSTLSNFRNTDIKEIAEIFVDKQYAGKTIEEIEDDDQATIYLILRDDLSILPQKDTVLKLNDIIVVRSTEET